MLVSIRCCLIGAGLEYIMRKAIDGSRSEVLPACTAIVASGDLVILDDRVGMLNEVLPIVVIVCDARPLLE